MLMRARALAFSGLCFLGQLTFTAAADNDSKIVFRRTDIDLKQYSLSTDDFPKVAFSGDGQMLCVWWGLGKSPVKFLVFDLDGKSLSGWKNTNHMEFLQEFPMIAWRWTSGEFAQGANFGSGEAFNFNRDLSRGVRIVVPANRASPVTAEMWKLSEPKHKLWSQPLPGSRDVVAYATPVGILNDWNNGSEFINLDGQRCAELDPQTGEIKRTFTFGPIETDEESKLKAKKFGVSEDEADAVKFFVGERAYDAKRRWIACGSGNGQRTRVIDVARPEKILFEANSNANPFRPRGGSWRVDRVEFLAEGNYLVTETVYSRRFGPFKYLTEVFDTSSWRSVWESKDPKTHSVTLSPDGRAMAYVRGTTVVICPFVTKEVITKSSKP